MYSITRDQILTLLFFEIIYFGVAIFVKLGKIKKKLANSAFDNISIAEMFVSLLLIIGFLIKFDVNGGCDQDYCFIRLWQLCVLFFITSSVLFATMLVNINNFLGGVENCVTVMICMFGTIGMVIWLVCDREWCFI